MTRGGKREGAGRPFGTTKENNKKMYSFRLSEEEEQAVRSLLKQMRNKSWEIGAYFFIPSFLPNS